jgi:hypothetical protein
MVLDRWLKAWQDRVGAALIAAIAAALALLALMGYGVAFESLILLFGAILGHVLAHSLSAPLRDQFARRFGTWKGVVAFALGIALGIMLLLVGLYVVGLPSLFSYEGGSFGTFVYGLALGVMPGLRWGLVPQPQPTPEEARQSRRAALQGSLILAGALVLIFLLASGFYVLVEYVAAPLIRYFAA